MGFMVSVNGGRAPAFVHDTVEQAITEALRLSKTRVGIGHEIQIVKQVMTIPARASGAYIDWSAVKVHDRNVTLNVGFWFDCMTKKL